MSVGVLVLSFNRPLWLREALVSAREADQIVIADDGSDFDPYDVMALVQNELRNTAVTLVRNPQISVYRRMRVPRMGALFNRALDAIWTPYVGYVCDDDLLAPGFLEAAGTYLDEHPEAHMVRGDWNILGTDRSCFEGKRDGWVITTGNFVHRMRCYHVENCRWHERTLTVQDAYFLGEYLRIHNLPHGGRTIPHVGRLAGWRREHPYNLIGLSDHRGFTPEAEQVLGGFLEDGH